MVRTNVSAEAVQITFNALAALAARSNAAFILAHHMRKNGAKDITSPDEAKESIRGSGDIVNRPRLSYALWPAGKDETNKVCRALGIPMQRNLVFHGAVVKANGKCNNEVQVYVRGDSGLLVDRTAAVKADYHANAGPIVDALVQGIADAAEGGRPFMRMGQAGLHARRSDCPSAFSTSATRSCRAWPIGCCKRAGLFSPSPTAPRPNGWTCPMADSPVARALSR